MKRFFLVSLCIFVFYAIDAQAANNWYVRPSGGSGSGTSWTAAWNDFSGINWSSVSCGDTIWVAGGSYSSSLNVAAKACSSGSPLAIRRARSDSTDCTGASGWSSGFDSTINQTNTQITIASNSSYITVSGRTTASGGGYGWKASITGTSGFIITIGGGKSNINYVTFEYMELAGSGGLSATNNLSGIFDEPAPCTGTTSHHTFSHILTHGWETGVYSLCVDYLLFDHIDMYDIYGTSTVHPNFMYLHANDYGTIRYSKFHDSNPAGVGIAFSDLDTGHTNYWNVYGNVFYNVHASDGTGTGMEVQHGNMTDLKIINNTFYNVDMPVRTNGGSCLGNSTETNNLVVNSGGMAACGTSVTNLTSSSSSIFANSAGNDYHIVSTVGSGYPRNAGTNMSTYLTTDMDGTTFAGDGSWDVGAYEYGGVVPYSYTPGGATPSPPSGLSIN